jgi:glycosyltransferase involved in cell wall biosynthesis
LVRGRNLNESRFPLIIMGAIMESEPKVSVIIPTYNMADTLGRAIDSVQQQTYSNIEIIVVNDGSKDDTGCLVRSAVANDPRIRYLEQMNSGNPAARNAGIRYSTGDMISFLDADDTLPAQSLEFRVNYLSLHPEKDLVFGVANYLDKQGRIRAQRRLKKVPDTDFAYWILSSPRIPFTMATLMYRHSVFSKIGFFNTRYKRVEDTEFAIRALTQLHGGYLPLEVYNYYYDNHKVGCRLSNRIFYLRANLWLANEYSQGWKKMRLLSQIPLVHTSKLLWECVCARK